MVTLAEIASSLGYNLNDGTVVDSIAIDTRKIEKNSIFVAFKGQSLDGHDFVSQAADLGALAAVVEKIQPNIKIPQFQVASSQDALKQMAFCIRTKIKCPIIAVTGSNGKTTVKNMLANIFPKPAFATIGNYNNQIGVPISLSHVRPDDLFAVFELGANKLGDIAYTVAMVQPHVALINNIGNAHLEGFGSEQGIAQAKGEIYAGLVASGVAVINQDDKWHEYWHPIVSSFENIGFSLQKNPKSSIYTTDLKLLSNGCYSFKLHIKNQTEFLELKIPGLHSVHNALAAAACAHAVGIEIKHIARGLATFAGVQGRLMRLIGKNHSLIIDDTYNANLNSFKAAINVLSAIPGERILVMGDMGELGHAEIDHHKQVGHFAKQSGLERLFTIGKLSQYAADAFGVGAMHFDSLEELISELLPKLSKETKILVKGSRSSGMERVVKLLVN